MVSKFFDGPIASIAPLLGVITSFQEQLEYGIRLSSLAIGLVVGSIHLWRLISKKPD
jgi:hypothetical protein